VVKKLLVVAVLLLVSACGVKPTGVVPAGQAPTLRNPGSSGRGTDVILYFVIDGRLSPVTRPSGGTTDVSTALSLLLNGPSDDERASGYTTMLPRERGPIALSPGTPSAVISFPFPVTQLTQVAVSQVVCTAFAAMAVQNTYVIDGTVTISGTDGQLPSQACQAF
jgi:hypothetical protein